MPDANVVGLEHIGVVVEDLDAAADFLVRAFGAEVMYDLFTASPEGPMLNDADGPTDEPLDLGDKVIVDAPQGAAFQGHRMVKLGDGATLELLQITAPDQRQATYADLGISHFSVFVHDLEAAAKRVEEAGGQVFDRFDMMGLESGDRAEAQYALGPAGLRVELISYRRQLYEDATPLRRSCAGRAT